MRAISSDRQIERAQSETPNFDDRRFSALTKKP